MKLALSKPEYDAAFVLLDKSRGDIIKVSRSTFAKLLADYNKLLLRAQNREAELEGDE